MAHHAYGECRAPGAWAVMLTCANGDAMVGIYCGTHLTPRLEEWYVAAAENGVDLRRYARVVVVPNTPVFTGSVVGYSG